MTSDTYISKLASAASAAIAEGQRTTATGLRPPKAVRYELIPDVCTGACLLFTSCLVSLPREALTLYPIFKIGLISCVMGVCLGVLLYRDRSRALRDALYPIHATAGETRVALIVLVLLLPGSILLPANFPLAAIAVALCFTPLALTLQRHMIAPTRRRNLTYYKCSAQATEADYPVNRLHAESEWPGSHPWYYEFCKRMLDLFVSSVLLVLLAPIFFVIAVLIRMSSRGPAFFIQERIGVGGVAFKMYKFRSMSSSAEKYEYSPTTSEDPRITRIGRLLRRSSLDELPQLFNVFRGDMSLVGPRPEMSFIVREYNDYERLRLQVIPGITGLWQLSKDRAHPIHENLHHDLSYIRERCLSLDVAILIHTVLFAMRGGI